MHFRGRQAIPEPSRLNADDRLSLDPFDRVEGNRIVEQPPCTCVPFISLQFHACVGPIFQGSAIVGVQGQYQLCSLRVWVCAPFLAFLISRFHRHHGDEPTW